MERGDADERTGAEVAVIGLAGRFPGAPSVEQLWENLKNGVESISFFTEQELLEAGVSPAQLARPGYVPAASVLEGVELFDAALFDIPPHEARLLDPQHRLFLETAWEALERAGYDSERYPGLVGLYAGVEMNTYLHNLFSQPEVIETAGAFQLEVSSDKDYLATRTSYKLSLRGPSLTVQSACSTSLVAVHLACQALLSGECDMALAGGVSLKLPAKSGYRAAEGGIHSPDGHCRAFDARAQGTVFGSGIGLVVLKRLPDALADGDLIHAVIRGSAVNNDGSQKAGYSAPGGEGQYQVVRTAHLQAEVGPETITYVEAHGTGTSMGDPIEVAALTRAFRAGTDKSGFCALGSAKTNVGHLRSAAGVTGLIKTVLSLRHRQIPPSLHFERPNPLIDFASSPFFVNDRLREWNAGGIPLRAGVSSFGVGGTNAHVIVEEPPAREPSPPPARPWQLLVLSAHTATALAAARTRLAEHLHRHPELPLADAAWTLQVGRRRLRHRGALVCRSPEEASAALEAGDSDLFATARQEKNARPAVFLFPGQGSQHPGMAREVYETEASFRRAVDRCCEILRPLLGLDLREVLYPRPGQEEDAARRLEQTALAQPALFVVEHSLAGLWMEWGVRPRALLGHSVGEFVAACLAGVFSLEDALALVAERGRLMQSMPPGAMLSVPVPEEEIAPLLGPGLALAAVNGPGRAVVSGPREAVEALAAELAGRGVACRSLHTSHAFHSPMMEPVLAPFEARVAAVRRRPPEIPFVSNLTGGWITAEEAIDPRYWARQLRGTVRFGDGLRTLAAEPEAVLLEVGPGQALASFARQSPDRPASQAVVRSLPHPKEAEPDGRFLTGAVGRLWLAGVEIDWQGFHAGTARRRVELPSYPFERQRYWIDRRPESVPGAARPDVRKEISDWFYLPSWQRSVPPEPEAGPLRWLLLGDGGGLAEVMARRLREQGHTIAEKGGEADRIVHLGCLGETGPDGEEIFHGLLGLAQELGRLPGRAELRVVTCGLQAVGREVVLAPDQATVLGPVRVLPLEHPNLGCAAVDVEAPWDDASRERLAEILINEAFAPADAAVVAWRGDERWVERFDPVRLPAADPARLPLRERGVYLITGGLGGLGLTLARELARSFRARLVLTGRALRGPDHPAIQELEALGAEVLALAADVTDEAAMRDVVLRTRERFGPLQGAIHAAGVPGGGVIQLKTAEAAARVLAPKMRGARVLANVLAGEPLDLLVFCSSTYALTGGVGQVDYCAANSFLDAFARHLAAERGIRAVSLGWGAWREVGMAVDATARSAAPAPPEAPVHPFLDRRLGTENGGGAVYETHFSPSRHWVLAEHRLLGTPTLPGTTYLEMARAAFADATGVRQVEIRDVAFTGPLLIVDGDAREVRTTLEPSVAETGETRFRIASRTGAGAAWQEHAHGRLRPLDGAAPARLDILALRARCGVRDIEAQGNVSSVAAGVVSWGARWQSFQRASLGTSEALVTLELPAEHAGDLDGLALHPALLDVATAAGASLTGDGAMLPHSYDRVAVLEPLPGRIHAHVRTAGETLRFDVTLLDDDGRVLVDIDGFTLKRVAAGAAGPGAARPRTPAGNHLWIAPAEGVDAFRRALSRGRFAQVAISPTDLPAAINALRREAARRAEPPAEARRFSRPELETDYAAPGTSIESALADVWQTVLGLERVGIHDNFFDLGGDSVVGIQLAAQAAARGLGITPEQLFRHQTIAALARALEKPAVPEAADTAPPSTHKEAFSPLDFPEAGLSQESLDRLLAKARGMA